MADRWDTGWVVIQSPYKPFRARAHRPNPDQVDEALCGRPVELSASRLQQVPVGLEKCVKCVRAVTSWRQWESKKRKKAKIQAERKVVKRSAVDPAEIDRRDRTMIRGNSVRTVGEHQPHRWLG